MAVFDSLDQVANTLEVFAGISGRSKSNLSGCLSAASDPGLLATDLAVLPWSSGVFPFGKLTKSIGKLVAFVHSTPAAFQ